MGHLSRNWDVSHLYIDLPWLWHPGSGQSAFCSSLPLTHRNIFTILSWMLTRLQHMSPRAPRCLSVCLPAGLSLARADITNTHGAPTLQLSVALNKGSAMWGADVRGDPLSAVCGSCSFPGLGNVYGGCHSQCHEHPRGCHWSLSLGIGP